MNFYLNLTRNGKICYSSSDLKLDLFHFQSQFILFTLPIPLCSEILAAKILQNNLVKGINLFGNEDNISQFVHKTNISGVDNSFVQNAFADIKNFEGILGLQLDVKKKKINKQTKAVWLGSGPRIAPYRRRRGHATLSKSWEFTFLMVKNITITIPLRSRSKTYRLI